MYPMNDICHQCGEPASLVGTVSDYRERLAAAHQGELARLGIGPNGKVSSITAFREKLAAEPKKLAAEPKRRSVLASMSALFPPRSRPFPVFGSMSEMLAAT